MRHPSVRLLERSRRPSAEICGARLRIERAILAGGSAAGICIMKWTGRLLHQPFVQEIGDMSSRRLTDELADKEACALSCAALYEIEQRPGSLDRQNDDERTYARRLKKAGSTPRSNAPRRSSNQRRVRHRAALIRADAPLPAKTATLVLRAWFHPDDAEEVGIRDIQAGSVVRSSERLCIGCCGWSRRGLHDKARQEKRNGSTVMGYKRRARYQINSTWTWEQVK